MHLKPDGNNMINYIVFIDFMFNTKLITKFNTMLNMLCVMLCTVLCLIEYCI